jgi:phage N-6-adenine-methyltransferase
MSDTAEVIQGRLGWESGDVSEASVTELEPHPKNTEIYGDTDELEQTFVESIREKGVLEPLVITEEKQVISGHRRLKAARKVDIDTVPVRVSDFDNDLAEREALIEFNRQREKTPGQIVNEFEEMLEVEKQRAKERKEEAGKENLQNVSGGNVSTTEDDGKAREKAAEKVNADVSGRTLEKGKNVKDKAESDDEPEEVQEAAQEAWDGLQSGEESFNSAHEKVKDAESEAKDTGEEHTVVDAATKQETDEWSSPRELVEPLAESVDEFDLDPCSGAETSPFASATYTEDDDGLSQEWHGKVWVNPPYSQMKQWTEKAIAEIENTETIFYLCKGDSSTTWWQDGADEAELICAIDHRLEFGDGGSAAPFASHIMVFGEIDMEAILALQEHGMILTPGWDHEY